MEKYKTIKYKKKVNNLDIANFFDQRTKDLILSNTRNLSHLKKIITQTNPSLIINSSDNKIFVKFIIGDTTYFFQKYNDTYIKKNDIKCEILLDTILKLNDSNLNFENEQYKNIIWCHIVFGYFYNAKIESKLNMEILDNLNIFSRSIISIVLNELNAQ